MFSDDRPLAPRWVLAHVNNLDYDSAFIAELRGGQQFRGWDHGMYQLVRLTDAVRTLTYVFVLANRDPKKKAPEPPELGYTPDQLTTKKQDKPGSFAFIAKAGIAAAKKRKETSQ